MYLILWALALQFGVAMATQKSDIAVIVHQPLGFKMCIELCSAIGGCQPPDYDPVQLRCTLEIKTKKTKSCGDDKLTMKTCTTWTRYSRNIHARKMGMRKVQQAWKVPRYKKRDKDKRKRKVPPCPSEFTLIENPKLCFKILLEAVDRTQRDRNERCSELIDSGRLLQLETPEKLAAVQKYVKPGEYVIGGRWSERTKKWMWLDGTYVNTTMFWNEKPRKYVQDRCTLTLYGSTNGHRFQDRIDYGRYRFICELPM